MTSSPATWDVGLSIAPYPGLRPFRREEADIFFGRDEQVDHLLAKLEQNHFLGVVGPSGAGKSSLVRAGLLSALEGGFLARAGVSWHVVEMRPGSHPLRTLAETLLESGLLGEHWDDHPQGVPFLTALLQRGPLSLINLLRERQLPPSANVLLVIDQFEEIFRFHDYGDPNEAIAFVSLLLATATQVGTPVFVVLTMRSDYLGDCAVFQGLPEALNDSQFLTPRLTREQCEAAMQGPAAVFDARVEPGLVNRILNDMGTDPDQLPLMQHALMRVWTLANKSHEQAGTSITLVGGTVPSEKASKPRDLQLTLRHYEAVGGLAQGLSRHADEVFDALTPEDRHVAEVLFRGLSERSQGQRDTRRPVVLKAIANIAEVSCEQVARIVEAFRHPDCSFLTPHAGIPLADDSLLDVSHESLIRQWERMATWVEKEHQSATMYRRLDQTARLWWQGQAGLWGDPDLGHALEWQTREKPNAEWANRYGGDFDQAMKFLRLSQEEHQRRQEEMLENERLRRRVHKLKLGLGVGGIVLLIISMLMFWTNYQRKEAEQARDDAKSAETRAAIEADNARDQQKAAERQQRIATAQRLAVEANVVRDRQPQLSLLLAIAGLRATRPDGQHELSAEQALRDALAVDPGYRLRGHQGPIESLTMSFDGRWLVTTSLDGTARLWSLSASDPSRESWLLQPPMPNFLTDVTTDEVEQLSFARQTSLNAAWPLVRFQRSLGRVLRPSTANIASDARR
jgi:energy-coupling factor transporter ATP-binding protein EcfA2